MSGPFTPASSLALLSSAISPFRNPSTSSVTTFWKLCLGFNMAATPLSHKYFDERLLEHVSSRLASFRPAKRSLQKTDGEVLPPYLPRSIHRWPEQSAHHGTDCRRPNR